MILMENGLSQDKINAGLLILSGAMMFDPLGSSEVAKSITVAIEKNNLRRDRHLLSCPPNERSQEDWLL